MFQSINILFIQMTKFFDFLFDSDSFLDPATKIGDQGVTMANLPTVVGITFSETEIFVVCYRMWNVLVFDSGTFVFLRSIPGVALKPWDITYSGELLFISEEESYQLHRIPVCTSELVSCWPVFGRKSTLSTAKSGNIIVTSDRHRFFVIMEFTTNGQVVRKLYVDDPLEELDYMLDRPAHAIHLDNGHFLFCLDLLYRSRVCLIDGQGNVVKRLTQLGWHASKSDGNGSGGSARPDESETNRPKPDGSGSDGPRIGRLYTDSIATDGAEPGWWNKRWKTSTRSDSIWTAWTGAEWTGTAWTRIDSIGGVWTRNE